MQGVGVVAIPCGKSCSLQRGGNLKIRYLLLKRILGYNFVTIDPQYPIKGQGVYIVKVWKDDGVFPFSDTASLVTRGTKNVQDTLGPLAVFFAIFHSGVSQFNHKARTLQYALATIG